MPSTSYFLCLHYFGLAVAHSHFSTSHTAHGFATSLSPSSFRFIYFLKAHLFISWACDSLFLPLGLNGFSIHSLTLFCSPCISCPIALLFLLWCYLTQACWASLGLLLIFPSMTQYSHLDFLVTVLAGSCDPFSFWASLAHLLSLGLFGPFPNSVFP